MDESRRLQSPALRCEDDDSCQQAEPLQDWTARDGETRVRAGGAPPSFFSVLFFGGVLLRHGRIGFTASSNCTHGFPSIGRRLQILNLRFSGFSPQFKRRPRRPVSTSALSRGRGERKMCVRFGEFDA